MRPVRVRRHLNDRRIPGGRTDTHTGEVRQRSRRGVVGKFMDCRDEPAGRRVGRIEGKSITVKNEFSIGTSVDDRELRRCTTGLDRSRSHLSKGSSLGANIPVDDSASIVSVCC